MEEQKNEETQGENNKPEEIKEKSVKEERIRKIAPLYYSRQDIRKAIFDFSKNRECVPRYFEGFGKRPDSFQYDSDTLELAKKGATSFHCSEELWAEPLELSTAMREEEIKKLRTGWDLCLPEFETLFIKEGGIIKRLTLKDLAEKYEIKDIGRYNLLKEDLKIMSLNIENYKIEQDTIKDLIIRAPKINEQIIKIIAEDGKEINVSEDHPVLTFTAGGIIQKLARDLNNKDYLLIPLEIDFPEYESIDLIEKIKESDYSENYEIKHKKIAISALLVEDSSQIHRIKGTVKNFIAEGTIPLNFYLNYADTLGERNVIKLRSRKSKLKIPLVINTDYNFGKLIGYYLSEGSLDKDRIEFTFHRKETKEAEDVISLFNKVFQIKDYNKKTIKFHKQVKSLKVRINSKILTILFRNILGFGFGAKEKRIPDWAYNCSKDFISGILTGYFIGDGSCIYEKNRKSVRITAASASKNLIEGLSLLCLRLGINCNLVKNWKYNLSIIKISGEEGVRKFVSYCKEFFEKKDIVLPIKLIEHPSKHSVYPPFLEKSLIKNISDRTKKINLTRAIRLNMGLNKKLAILAPNKHLKLILNSSLFPIKVRNIEKAAYRGLLYDLETVKNHNFLQGDGVFTHNCIDIDCKYLEYSKKAADAIIRAIKKNGVDNLSVKFSGGKGFHIIIPWKAFPEEISGKKTKDMFPEWPRLICQYLKEESRKFLEQDLYSSEDSTVLSKLKKGIRCERCKNMSEQAELIFFACPNCRTKMENLTTNFERKRIIRCPNCQKEMQETKKDILYQCNACKLDSRKNPENFKEAIMSIDIFDVLGLDVILVSPRHLFRMPYSLHEKTALASVVLEPDKIREFEITDANPMKVIPKNFTPDCKENEAKELLRRAIEFRPPEKKLTESGALTDNKNLGEKKFKDITITNLTPELYPPTITKILEGMKTDGRKRALFILLSFFKSLKLSDEQIALQIETWNKKNNEPLPPSYVKGQISWYSKLKEARLPPNFDKPYYKEIGIIPTKEELAAKNPVSWVIRKSFSRGYSNSNYNQNKGKLNHKKP